MQIPLACLASAIPKWFHENASQICHQARKQEAASSSPILGMKILLGDYEPSQLDAVE